jgi:xanthine/CO dehydrogenase XdhC/CoxF family maturation factor
VHELGSIEVYLEPSTRQPRLLVFSATPVAAHLVRWARDVGFDPVVVEPRSDRPGPPGVALLRSIDDIQIDEDTYAVHTDHDAPGVADSLAALLRSPAAFVGAMGSRRHVGPYVERLREMGFADEDLRRIRTPLGLDIGARTAEEIALSILAGLVAARRESPGGWLDAADPRS